MCWFLNPEKNLILFTGCRLLSFYKCILQESKERDMQQIKVIAFDADDTLWDNQVFYDKVESEFCHLLAGYERRKKSRPAYSP